MTTSTDSVVDILPIDRPASARRFKALFSSKTARTVLATCLLSAGCVTDPAIPTVVKIPVIQPCIKEAPEKPQTIAEADILKMDEFQATMVVWVERLLLKAFAEKADAIISACR